MSRRIIFSGYFCFLLLNSNVFAGQQAITYHSATEDTVGVFKNCKVGVPCRIKAPTRVAGSVRNCKYWDTVPELVRSFSATEEAQRLGIVASGYITIYPPPGFYTNLNVGSEYVTQGEWGNPVHCGQVTSYWEINDIYVTFTRPIAKTDLPVRILAMGRGRREYISGFNTEAGKGRAAANIVIDGTLIDDSPDIFEPSCKVNGDVLIDHGNHTPESIENHMAKSSPVVLQCNGEVSVRVDITGNDRVSGYDKNWTTCGYGACEINFEGNNNFTVSNSTNIIFSSTWHSLGKAVSEGSFTGAAIATLNYN